MAGKREVMEGVTGRRNKGGNEDTECIGEEGEEITRRAQSINREAAE